MKWAEQQRHEFISDKIKESGTIQRKDLIEKFKISMPQASIDLRKWQEKNPCAIQYSLKNKRYERV